MDIDAHRPIPAIDRVFIEELTWMEVRDAIKAGKTTVIVGTGGIEQNGPYVATGKHNYVLEATTEKSRDRYDHFGFQVGAAIKDHNARFHFSDPRLSRLSQLERPIVFGKGKFDSSGYRAKGESAEGFQIYAMVKVSYFG